jgi:hypothetical protein
MSDVAWHAKIGASGVNNGSVVTTCSPVGRFNKSPSQPVVNVFIPSGTLFQKYDNRFDDKSYYNT